MNILSCSLALKYAVTKFQLVEDQLLHVELRLLNEETPMMLGSLVFCIRK